MQIPYEVILTDRVLFGSANCKMKLPTKYLFNFRWYNVVDFAVVCITFIIVITATTGAGQWAENLSILTVIRFVRLVRI